MAYKNGVLKIDVDSYKPLREIVFLTIRKAIIGGDFKPGHRLMEVQLAEQMRVSRTPVREAIRKLELEGLVIMVPRKGAYVAGLTSDDIREVVEIRAVLEGLAAKLAAQNSTDSDIERLKYAVDKFQESVKNENIIDMIKYDAQYHDIIYKSSKNNKLLTMINNLKEQVQRYREAYFTKISDVDKILQEHTEMLDAIEKKDHSLARKIAEKHIATTEELIKDMDEQK